MYESAAASARSSPMRGASRFRVCDRIVLRRPVRLGTSSKTIDRATPAVAPCERCKGKGTISAGGLQSRRESCSDIAAFSHIKTIHVGGIRGWAIRCICQGGTWMGTLRFWEGDLKHSVRTLPPCYRYEFHDHIAKLLQASNVAFRARQRSRRACRKGAIRHPACPVLTRQMGRDRLHGIAGKP